MITVNQLAKLMPLTVSSKAKTQPALMVEFLNKAMAEFNINNSKREAAFLANLAVESTELTRFEENLNYSSKGLTDTWPRIFPPEIAIKYARKPVEIASRAYANRMGNGSEESREGWTYRGRGPIQLTGKANYIEFGKKFNVDLVNNPDLAASPELGLRIAASFFDARGCNILSDNINNFNLVVKKINGGDHGLADRRKYYQNALVILGALSNG